MNSDSRVTAETPLSAVTSHGDFQQELGRGYAVALAVGLGPEGAESALMEAIDSVEPCQFSPGTLRSAIIATMICAQLRLNTGERQEGREGGSSTGVALETFGNMAEINEKLRNSKIGL